MTSETFPTRFDSTLDLARLPWFEVRGGNRLVMTDDALAEVGPIIDMHTHLAMGFFRRLTVDLHAETPTTAYYLPVTLPVDLDAYSNTNLDRSSMFAMKADVSVLGLTAQGMRTTHTAPNLLRDMDALGIVSSVVLPFDLPIGARNADHLLEVARRYPRLLPFGSVHPLDRDAEARLDRQQAAGAHGVKLHPNGQFIAPDHPKTVHLCGRCGARGLPVLFHCGPVGIEPKAAAAPQPGEPLRAHDRREPRHDVRARPLGSAAVRAGPPLRRPLPEHLLRAVVPRPRGTPTGDRRGTARTGCSTAPTGPSTTRPSRWPGC